MKNYIFIFMISLLAFNLVAAESNREWRRIIDLRGHWKFSINDNHNWSQSGYDDSNWESIFVPSKWEDEGYPGYDGFAWYRKTFTIEREESELYLKLGYIDDVDQVFINGEMVGSSGTFPPRYNTAYNQERIYRLPDNSLKKGKNQIAVRVYDSQIEGGIIRGEIGIYKRLFPVMTVSLEGMWKFMADDDEQFKEYNYNDKKWDDFIVPQFWESQGLPKYDGYGWYRKRFRIPKEFKDERLILLLGKIDDFDETYINGEFVDATGYMHSNPRRNNYGDEYATYRAYRVDGSKLFYDKDNIIAVRVYDGRGEGGIYEGPVGILLYDDYREWKRRKGNNFKNLFLDIFIH
jgi:sialate O-acetylesterase